MYKVTNEFPHEIILNQKKGPFVSIYQPTESDSTNNKQDLIRFKNAMKEVENSFKKQYDDDVVAKRMKPLIDLYDDRIFWNKVEGGVAVLSDEEDTIVYNLKRPVKELAIVSDSFHIKPLIRNFQSADRYHLLGLSRNEFQLFEGNRYGFERVDLGEDTPTTLEEIVGKEFTEPHLTPGTYGGTGGTPQSQGRGTPMYHGHGGKKDEVQIDTERFFKHVDKFILDEYSQKERIPLVLVALDEHQGEFKKISRNNYLLDEGINLNFEVLNKQQLKETFWERLEPLYIEKTKELVDRFETSRAQDLGSSDIVQVGRAAIENRIDTLLIEADREIGGKLNKETGEITEGNIEKPNFDDLLDDIGEMVLKNKGEVIVLPKGRMPSDTGVAAIYRF